VEERLRLLVVDDCLQTSETLAALLWIWGYEVQLAHDGPKALETARTFGPHIALLDIGLPGMDGFEVARALRRRPAEAKLSLVALTGYLSPDAPAQARQAGFDHYLVKPVDPADLRVLLETLDPRAAGPPSPRPSLQPTPTASTGPCRPQG
jgi:CheY-like chemotaxis protein